MTATLSEHTKTNAEVIRKFLPVSISFQEKSGGWLVKIGSP